MKNIKFAPLVLAMAALLAGCGTTPTSTSLLAQARQDYQAALSSPTVANYATLELKQAGEALELANAAAKNNDSGEKVDKLAYLAKQQIAVTQQVAMRKAAEADVANSAKVRDQMRLDQRTNEANLATANAEQYKLDAQVAQIDAQDAQRKTQAAQAQASEAQRQTQEAQARAAQLEAQLADLAARKTERGMVITLGDVLFGTDLARLNSEGMRSAQKLAVVLKNHPQRTVLVEGFTDSTGTSAHNQELSERRAQAVRSALLEQGVEQDRVTVRGYGENFPVAANDTANNRQLNRRVEIILSDDSGKITPR